jgi:hypothetical protein
MGKNRIAKFNILKTEEISESGMATPWRQIQSFESVTDAKASGPSCQCIVLHFAQDMFSMHVEHALRSSYDPDVGYCYSGCEALRIIFITLNSASRNKWIGRPRSDDCSPTVPVNLELALKHIKCESLDPHSW